MPTFVFIKEGKKVDTLMGANKDKLQVDPFFLPITLSKIGYLAATAVASTI